MKIPNAQNTLSSIIWHSIKKQKKSFLGIFILANIWAFNDTLFPYFLKLIINNIENFQETRQGIYQVIGKSLGMLIGFWIIIEASMRALGFLSASTFPLMRANIRQFIYKNTHQRSMQFLMDQQVGNVVNKVGDLPSACEYIIESVLITFIPVAISFFISFSLLCSTNSLFGLIVAIWLIIHLSIGLYFLKEIDQRYQTHANALSELMGKIVDSLSNLLNVRIFEGHNEEDRYYRHYQEIEVNKAKKAGKHAELMKLLQGINSVTLLTTTILLLIREWVHHNLCLGDFTLIMMLTYNMINVAYSINYWISNFLKEINRGRAALSILNVPETFTTEKSIPINEGSITFLNVHFGYKKDFLIFENLNLHINPGEKIGIIGKSGVGKTTFVHLLMGLYEVPKGQIFIDSTKIRDVEINGINYISQDPILFNRTIIDNIRYGNVNATEDTVKLAGSLAGCDDFIKKLDKGYDTIVGERGTQLSAGERQRIAIARALLKGGKVVVIDDATSMLDVMTETKVREGLRVLMKDKTSILITNRVDWLSEMDRIFVFNEGGIVKEETPGKLLIKDRPFKESLEINNEVKKVIAA